MKNSVRRYDLGIALASEVQLKLLPELGRFTLLEMHGELLDEMRCKVTDFSGFERIIVREMAPGKVINGLAEVSLGVKNDFFALFTRRCAVMEQYNISRGVLGIDLEAVCRDSAFAAGIADVFRCCCGIAARYRIELGLEYRIPGFSSEVWSAVQKFRKLVGCQFFTMIDFHPHESGSLDALAELEGKMPFDSALWRIAFDGSSGNYPGSEVIRRVDNAVHRNSWRMPEVIYAPGQWADREVYIALADKIFASDTDE